MVGFVESYTSAIHRERVVFLANRHSSLVIAFLHWGMLDQDESALVVWKAMHNGFLNVYDEVGIGFIYADSAEMTLPRWQDQASTSRAPRKGDNHSRPSELYS